MFSKVKCPACGVKNPKERMTCIECGAPLSSGQVGERLTEESSELTREEAVARLEKQESQHLVYETTFGGTKVFINKVTEMIVIEKRFFLFFRRQLVVPLADVTSVAIDYSPQRVLRTQGSSPLPRRQPEWSRRGWSDYISMYDMKHEWEVSINIGVGEKVRIAQGEDEWGMWALANKISELVGKEMVDKHGEHTTTYDPNMTRDEAVARFKKRMEQEAGDSK